MKQSFLFLVMFILATVLLPTVPYFAYADSKEHGCTYWEAFCENGHDFLHAMGQSLLLIFHLISIEDSEFAKLILRSN